jgi:hypothetical protein
VHPDLVCQIVRRKYNVTGLQIMGWSWLRSGFLPKNIEGPGRVGAMRRRAFRLRPMPSLPSRPFSSHPSRLRACGAARCACPQGISARPIPAARCLAPLQESRTGRAPRPSRRGACPPAPYVSEALSR